MKNKLAYSQGAYFSITGIWPIIDIGSFMAITGPKTDIWLVHMVGLLAFVIGTVLIYSARKGTVHNETKILAIGAALSFFLIDVIYVNMGRISKVYLLDALVEAVFVLLWIMAFLKKENPPLKHHVDNI